MVSNSNFNCAPWMMAPIKVMGSHSKSMGFFWIEVITTRRKWPGSICLPNANLICGIHFSKRLRMVAALGSTMAFVGSGFLVSAVISVLLHGFFDFERGVNDAFVLGR